jgi:UDP-N-acetylglucosamine 2-epimerase (non-hydrolysing)
MIYIILGTKGQFMKMFPVMKLFDEYKIPYKFVHTCQHFMIVRINRRKFKVRKPDIFLTMKKKDLKNIWDFLKWAPMVLWNARKLPIKKNDYVIIHGDTESSLLTLLIGLYYKAKIVHIEAGLRSGDLLNPFPEEIVRRIVDRFSDINFCPTKEDAENIRNKKTIRITNGNTVHDSVNFALKLEPSSGIKALQGEKYAVFLLHRKENLFVKKRIEKAIGIIETVLKSGLKVICILHKNTIYEIKRNNLWHKLVSFKRGKNFVMHENFFSYVNFMHLVKNSQFVVCDSGGLQEETYYMNKPILLLRHRTERQWGLGETACLADFDDEKISYFLNNVKLFKRKDAKFGSASKYIADFFVKKLRIKK